ncbi:Transcriptional repressor CTCFL [Frankliniella fusca]|uniref:Transcriptional repressor CTCFL n=1 Tax=Frankliniella fusca TaxID=407009 RepID=A0AAE1LJ09_9NEOP|nr:Transcriptional repressor CTCFL [Frankliniella fusca]
MSFFGDPWRFVADTGEGLVCPVCQKKFTRRDNLKSHFSNLHGEHRGPFRCSYCFKVTKNKMSLRAHMKNYHPNKRSSGSNNGDNVVKLDDVSMVVGGGGVPVPAPAPAPQPASSPSPLTLQ